MISTNKKYPIVMKKVSIVAKKPKVKDSPQIKSEQPCNLNLTKINSESLKSKFKCIICEAMFVTHKNYLEHFRY